MRLFKRGPKRPFWETPPFVSDDPGVLQQRGILAVGSGDGKTMIATGWAIWRLAGLHQYQAADLIRDGYRAWSDSQDFDVEQAAQFLSELIRRLSADPVLVGNIWNLPPEEVIPISTHYSLRSWAVSERLEMTDADERSRWEAEAFRLISASYREFVPHRSERWASEYATANGLS